MYADEESLTGSVLRNGLRCGKGAFLRTSGSGTEIACGVALDFTLDGDVADLTVQAWNYYTGKETDPIIATLAGIGLALSALPLVDWIDPTTTRYGALAAKHTLKAAKHARVSGKLNRALRRSIGKTFDPSALKKAAVEGPAALSKYFRRASTKKTREVLGDLGSMATTGSMSTPITAMKYADDLHQLSASARITRAFGKQSDAVMNLLRHRLHRLFFKIPKITYKVRRTLTGYSAMLLAAALGLVTSLSDAISRRAFKFAVLRFLPAFGRR